MTIKPYRQGREGWGEKGQPQRSQNEECVRWKLRQVWICSRILPILYDLIEFLLTISLVPVLYQVPSITISSQPPNIAMRWKLLLHYREGRVKAQKGLTRASV